MSPVNMLEAKSNLSRLVEAVETGKVAEIIIARNGRPAARLVPIATHPRRSSASAWQRASSRFPTISLKLKPSSTPK